LDLLLSSKAVLTEMGTLLGFFGASLHGLYVP
jgi:hypothetical protein